MRARDGFDCIDEGSGVATDIGSRALRLIESVQRKLGEFERQPASVADVVLGRCAAKLSEIPIADLDATATKLEQHIEKHGCCTVRCLGDTYQLSVILQQLRSTQEQLQPYRPAIAGVR